MPRVRKPPPAGYSQRDAQAPAAPTGMPYGQHQASIDAQKVVPLPNATAPAPSAPAAPGPPTGGFDMMAALEAAKAHNPSMGGFGDPTTQPHVPLTSGIASGPGPGPEALNLPSPVTNLAQLLSAMASSPQSNADVQFLARSVAGGNT